MSKIILPLSYVKQMVAMAIESTEISGQPGHLTALIKVVGSGVAAKFVDPEILKKYKINLELHEDTDVDIDETC